MNKEDYARYTTAQVAASYQISLETVRLWCSEFERHLSPRANPGHRHRRAFSESDMEVLSLVAELKAEGFTFQDIQTALDNGQRGSLPLLIPNAESDALILQEAEQRLTLQIKQLESLLTASRVENDSLKEENSQLKDKLDVTERGSLKHEVRAEMLSEQVEKLERRVKELMDERGRLEREIGSMESDLRHQNDED